MDPNGKRIMFELKTSSSARYAIREALGQLLEYDYFRNFDADKLVVVSTSKIDSGDILYIQDLRQRYNLPVYYQTFNPETKTLGELV